jgi:uncharacterized repeat protein (TIGR02543 family)
MKTTVALSRRKYLVWVGIVWIVVALVAGIAGCGGGTPARYDLTMVADPAAGGTAADETDRSPYAAGAAINIKAEANTGYAFAGWTASAGGFADANAEETTFTMPARDVIVTANFEQSVPHTLTMAADPVAGGAVTDQTHESPYVPGTVVTIKAEASPGYKFAGWTAPAGAFGDASAEETTFTMPDQDITITANFIGTLDHGTAYMVDWETAPYIGEVVYLEDQFCAVDAIVEDAMGFVIPAEKVHGGVMTPVSNPDHCLTVYLISYGEETGEWSVEVENQFGTQNLIVYGPIGLAVPTQSGGHQAPIGLDHYLLYEVIDYTGFEEAAVELSDELLDEALISGLVYNPMIFASPARKTVGAEVTEIVNPDVHAVLCQTPWGDMDESVEVVNQFGDQTLDVYGPYGLVVPSQKKEFEPPEHPLATAAVLGDYGYQLIHLLWANDIGAEEREWDVVADIGDYDVVVVNEPDDPGSIAFQAFLEAASDSGVGIVFTSSYATDWSWGISLLQQYFGDPVGQSEDYSWGDVYYKVTQEHPIFDGWDVGDEITIITGGDWDHAWFWGYSGDVIGEVGAAGVGIRGDAVALATYGGSNHVLLASLGPQDYTHVAHWTDDGKTVFINAVRFAASIAA